MDHVVISQRRAEIHKHIAVEYNSYIQRSKRLDRLETRVLEHIGALLQLFERTYGVLRANNDVPANHNAPSGIICPNFPLSTADAIADTVSW